MKQEFLSQYQAVMDLADNLARKANVTKEDIEDCIQDRIEFLLTTDRDFEDESHFAKSLSWFATKQRRPWISQNQQKLNTVSLSDMETEIDENPILISIPQDEFLYDHIVEGFTDRETDVFQLRTIGHTKSEISEKLGISEKTVQRIYSTIDRKISKMDLSVSKGAWYNGSGISSKHDIWKATKQNGIADKNYIPAPPAPPAPPRIEPLPIEAVWHSTGRNGGHSSNRIGDHDYRIADRGISPFKWDKIKTELELNRKAISFVESEVDRKADDSYYVGFCTTDRIEDRMKV